MPPDLASNVMLAVLWAALANTVPAAFWSAAFLLPPAHACHLDAVLRALPAPGDAEGLVQVRPAYPHTWRHVCETRDGLPSCIQMQKPGMQCGLIGIAPSLGV